MAKLQPHPPRVSNLPPFLFPLPSAACLKSQVPSPSSSILRAAPILPGSFSHSMSSASFRLEFFRPWNPFQDKAQPPRDSLDICRYPSPVSITATPPPSNSSNPASKSQKSHSHSSKRHPLPARPPVEVCFDSGQHSVVQTARHEPEDLGSIASDSTHTETSNPNDILQLQDLSGSEDLGHAPISDSIGLGAEHRFPDFGPCDLEPAVIAGQLPQDVDSGSHILTRELPGVETIDPAILNDHTCPATACDGRDPAAGPGRSQMHTEHPERHRGH